MKKILIFLLPIFFALFYSKPAEAIIFLPAVILIPIANIIAVFFGGFTIVGTAFSAVVSKLFNKPFIKVIGFVILAIIFITILISIFLKVQNPARPWI